MTVPDDRRPFCWSQSFVPPGDAVGFRAFLRGVRTRVLAVEAWLGERHVPAFFEAATRSVAVDLHRNSRSVLTVVITHTGLEPAIHSQFWMLGEGWVKQERDVTRDVTLKEFAEHAVRRTPVERLRRRYQLVLDPPTGQHDRMERFLLALDHNTEGAYIGLPYLDGRVPKVWRGPLNEHLRHLSAAEKILRRHLVTRTMRRLGCNIDPEALKRPAIPWVSCIFTRLFDEFFRDDQGCHRVDEVVNGFHAFATGELRLESKDPDLDDDGEPDSYLYLLFGECALVALELNLDPEGWWHEIHRGLLATQESFLAVYPTRGLNMKRKPCEHTKVQVRLDQRAGAPGRLPAQCDFTTIRKRYDDPCADLDELTERTAARILFGVS